MAELYNQHVLAEKNSNKLAWVIEKYNIDLFGFADLKTFKHIANSNSIHGINILKNYKYAIVMGVQYGKFGIKTTGDEVALFLEEIAFKLMMNLTENERYAALIIHTEDEFDPKNRMGLMSLKALAKESGIGWMGRSLLVVSPNYGPVHRIVAILTDMPLVASGKIANNCKDCYLCIEKCPYSALKIAQFTNQPKSREDVLDINKCNGDSGCKVCITICPWLNVKNYP